MSPTRPPRPSHGHKTALAAVLAAILAAGCSGTTTHGASARSKPAPEKTYRWVKSARPVVSDVVVASGRAFGTVVDGDGLAVGVFDRKDGRQVGTLPMVAPSEGDLAPAPVLAGGRVIVARSDDGWHWTDAGRDYPAPNVIAGYSPGTLNEAWTHRSEGVKWLGACGDEVVCAVEWVNPGATNLELRALDAKTGVLRWSVPAGEESGLYMVTAWGGTIYVLTEDLGPGGALERSLAATRWDAYRVTTGEKLWGLRQDELFAEAGVKPGPDDDLVWTLGGDIFVSVLPAGAEASPAISVVRSARTGKFLRRVAGAVQNGGLNRPDVMFGADRGRLLVIDGTTGATRATGVPPVGFDPNTSGLFESPDGRLWLRPETGAARRLTIRRKTAILGAPAKPGEAVLFVRRQVPDKEKLPVALPYGRELTATGCCVPVDAATGKFTPSVQPMPVTGLTRAPEFPTWLDPQGYIHMGTEAGPAATTDDRAGA